jgi:ATP/maltotriose-dependent transcriptional regulator MalT
MRAIKVVEQNYWLFVREHDHYCAAMCASTLGRAHWRLGDLVAARVYLDDAEHHFRDLGNLIMAARVLYFRASLSLEQGNIAKARHDLVQAFEDLSSQARTHKALWRLVERAGTLACRKCAPKRPHTYTSQR